MRKETKTTELASTDRKIQDCKLLPFLIEFFFGVEVVFAKTLSATSTILLTIYTIFMVLAEVGMFSICNFVAHMVNSGVDIASGGITSGGCYDYALPGAAIGGMFAGLGGLAWVAVAAVMVFFIIICKHLLG